jgi:hypothetical protein
MLNAVMLSVVMPHDIMISVVEINVIMLNVAAPRFVTQYISKCPLSIEKNWQMY